MKLYHITPTTLYHVTPTRNLAKVGRDGLKPKIGPRSRRLGEKRPAIYFFPTLANIEDGLDHWMEREFGAEARLALLSVIVPVGVAIHSDADYERHVYDPIPHLNLRLLSRDLLGESKIWTLPP